MLSEVEKRKLKYRQEAEMNANKRKIGEAKKYGTSAESTAVNAYDSIIELDKLSQSKGPLTPEQKKDALTNIAGVFIHDIKIASQSQILCKRKIVQ